MQQQQINNISTQYKNEKISYDKDKETLQNIKREIDQDVENIGK